MSSNIKENNFGAEQELPPAISWRNQAKKSKPHSIGKTRRLLFRGPQDLQRIGRSIEVRLAEGKAEIVIVNLNHLNNKKS
jgi:hypothetical protein